MTEDSSSSKSPDFLDRLNRHRSEHQEKQLQDNQRAAGYRTYCYQHGAVIALLASELMDSPEEWASFRRLGLWQHVGRKPPAEGDNMILSVAKYMAEPDRASQKEASRIATAVTFLRQDGVALNDIAAELKARGGIQKVATKAAAASRGPDLPSKPIEVKIRNTVKLDVDYVQGSSVILIARPCEDGRFAAEYVVAETPNCSVGEIRQRLQLAVRAQMSGTHTRNNSVRGTSQ